MLQLSHINFRYTCHRTIMSQAMRITEAEWEVMVVVWDRAPVAANPIFEALKARKGWTLATVRTLLRRLVRKGALHQERDGRRFLYTPRVSRDACVRRESDSFLDRVLGRAPATTILYMVKKADFSRKDIQELRKILREKENK